MLHQGNQRLQIKHLKDHWSPYARFVLLYLLVLGLQKDCPSRRMETQGLNMDLSLTQCGPWSRDLGFPAHSCSAVAVTTPHLCSKKLPPALGRWVVVQCLSLPCLDTLFDPHREGWNEVTFQGPSRARPPCDPALGLPWHTQFLWNLSNVVFPQTLRTRALQPWCFLIKALPGLSVVASMVRFPSLYFLLVTFGVF